MLQFYSFPLEHHERYYLYLIISVTIGVLLCLIIITGRIIIQKQREESEDSSKDEPKFQKSNTGETIITKGYSGDSITDIEGGDIDLTTPIAITNLPLKNEVSLIDCNNNEKHETLNIKNPSFLLLKFFINLEIIIQHL